MFKNRIITNTNTRINYPNCFEPVTPFEGQIPKYSASILIPKDDTLMISKINEAMQEAINDGIKRFGPIFDTEELRLPLHTDNAERNNRNYEGYVYLNATNYNPPKMVDRSKNPITDPNEIYSGCYVRAILEFYPYCFENNIGIATKLLGVQKVKDGERFGSDDLDFTDLDENEDQQLL